MLKKRRAALERGEAIAEAGVAEAVEAAGIAAYCWTIGSDEIRWSRNAPEVLEVEHGGIRSGRGYAALLDPRSRTSRYDTVMEDGSAQDGGTGVTFRIEYALRAPGRGASVLWVEDQGRWHAGPDGRPGRVLGAVRRIDERQMTSAPEGDPLTGMMSRAHFLEALNHAIAAAAAQSSACALLIASIGNITAVNDAYGRRAGDEVIAETAQRLARAARAGDGMARCSGASFGLILRRCGEDELPAAAQRLLTAVSTDVIATRAGPAWPQLSMGAVILPRHAGDAANALARAAEALREARAHAQGGIAVYCPSAGRRAERNANGRSAAALLASLQEGRTGLAFQPVVDPRTHTPAFHQAQLMVEDAGGGTRNATCLMPLAEGLGLSWLVDRASMEQAVEALLGWPDVHLCVSLSGATVKDAERSAGLIEILKGQADVTRRLIVEIAGSIAGDCTASFLAEIKALGGRIALGGVGADPLRLFEARRFGAAVVKFDWALFRELAGENGAGDLMRSLSVLARSMGTQTVAEGVEDAADAALLEAFGIDLMCGSLFDGGPAQPCLPASGGGMAEPRSGAPVDHGASPLEHVLKLLDQAFSPHPP